MVANKLMRGDTVLPVAHHRSEADVVEEVCGRTEPIHQKSVINRHVHHRQNFHSSNNHASKELVL